MALTNDDKQWIKGAIADGVVEALETVVLPRFDEHIRNLSSANSLSGIIAFIFSHSLNINSFLFF